MYACALTILHMIVCIEIHHDFFKIKKWVTHFLKKKEEMLMSSIIDLIGKRLESLKEHLFVLLFLIFPSALALRLSLISIFFAIHISFLFFLFSVDSAIQPLSLFSFFPAPFSSL